MKLFPAFAALLILVVGGCNRAPKTVTISEWEQYQDPYFKCTFVYPKGWTVVTDAAKVTAYSLADGAQKFFDPDSKGEGGSQIIVAYEKPVSQSLDSSMVSFRDEMSSAGFTIHSTDPVTIDGTPGYRIDYSGQYNDRTHIRASRAIAVKDSMLYSVSLAGFNDFYDEYKTVFDTVLASVKLPSKIIVAKGTDPAIPSTQFTQFKNAMLEISYPANFETEFPPLKGDTKFSLELKGYRQDCTVRIDVFPAKGNPVEKVFEQNEKFYKHKSKSEVTVGQLKALYLDYSPTKNVESRVYFLVKNDQVYRILFNYFQPMKKEFLPAFEKTVASLRIP